MLTAACIVAGKLVDDEDGARMRQMRVEASEKVQEASQSSGVTRASVAKAPPSQVLKKHGTPAVGMAGRLAPGNAELDTAAAPQVRFPQNVLWGKHNNFRLLCWFCEPCLCMYNISTTSTCSAVRAVVAFE